MSTKYRLNYRNAILLALGGLFIAGGCKTHFATTTGDFTPQKNVSEERGKMLVMSSCGGCHYDPDTKKLSGKQYMGTPKIAGKMFAANLTKSETHSPLQKYSEAEFAYLMRTGIAQDGHFIPYMLRPNMSDADISAMFAYLHSSDENVQPVNAVKGETHLSLIGKMGKPFLGKPLDYRSSVATPNMNDEVDYGRYLVDNIGCFHCHSKKGDQSLDYMQPEKTKGYMAGGRKFKMPSGVVRGANITMDAETGIGNFTKDDFRNAVLHAKDPSGKTLRPPMEAFHHMTDMEADAIYAYLKTLMPQEHKVKGQ